MKTKQVLFSIVTLAALFVSACSSSGDKMMDKTAPTADAMMAKETPTADAMMNKDTPTADAMMGKETPTADAMMAKETPTADAMMDKETPTADAMMAKETPTADAMMKMPGWYSTPVKNVSTGETFTINDFKGKVILVEAMAVWCSTCLKQQGEIKALHDSFGQRDDFVSISLDIDPNEDASKLKSFIESNHFDWLYAVSTADISRELSTLYGNQFLNPPSAPILVIDRHGEAHPMPFGLKSTDDLKKFIQPFLDGTM
jgi:hypothetical protein